MLQLELSPAGGLPEAAAGRLVRTWSDDRGTAFARAFVDAPARWIDWPGLGTFEFTPPSRTVRLHPITTDVPRARDTFVRIVQPIILQALGAESLHGSAVAGPLGAVVLAGKTGNGKSTLAWALNRVAGYQQIADDAVVLEGFDESTRPVVRSLPFRPRLRQPSADALIGDSRVEADTVDPTDRALPLQAVIVLEQDARHPGDPTTSRLGASEAFTAVVTHAYAFDEEDQEERERMSRHYLALVAAVPVLRLRYRPDFAAMPLLIDTMLRAVADSATHP